MRQLIFASRLIAGGLVCLAFSLAVFGTTNTVKMGDFYYDPINSTISPGDTVLWTNVGLELHDSRSRTNLWQSPQVSSGGTYAFTFTNAGVYPYFCFTHKANHPEQTGTVSVVTTQTNPPSAVTLLNPTFNGTAFSFSFATQVGYAYQGEYSPSVNPVNWFTFTNFIGDGAVMQCTDSSLTNPARFYRVGAH